MSNLPPNNPIAGKLRLRVQNVTPVLAAGLLFLIAAPLAADDAYLGEPFGVASVTFPAGDEDLSKYSVIEKNGRAFYPTFSRGTARRFLGEIFGVRGVLPTREVNCMFLFKGTEPLEVTVFTPKARTIKVTPRVGRTIPTSLLWQGWWREFNAGARSQSAAGDYSPITWSYLTAMLSRRLNLEPPLMSRTGDTTEHEVLKTLELMVGAERMKSQVLLEAMNRRERPRAATVAPPADLVTAPLELSPSEVPVEPIAMRVPQDCFYVRFGSFSNLMWVKKLAAEYGADLSRMATLRSQDSGASDKFPSMLGLQENDLAEMFGGAIIDDIAVIGRDLFLGDGAAAGILFKAKASPLLSADLKKQLTASADANPSATIETITIGEHKVLHVDSTDGRLRSFYAFDGNYHLVTTSRTIAEQFLATGDEGLGSLGASAEFRHARTLMPLERDDTVFAYISSAFLWGLASPDYQIELRRRLESVAEMEILKLAQLAAGSEGVVDQTNENLERLGFLPPGFGVRPDGSVLLLTEKGPRDSIRGYRGSFVPIPDMPLTTVTPKEADRFRRQAEFYARNWKQMDPMMIGVKRYDLRPDEHVERVAIDANITPFTEEKYGWLAGIIGPPMKQQITHAPNDIITFQASVNGRAFNSDDLPHHIFLGVQDTAPSVDLRPSGAWQIMQILQGAPAYLGSWPKLGSLDFLPADWLNPSNAEGYSELLLGSVKRWQKDGFSVISFHKSVLEQTTPHLKPIETENPAQIRLYVGDIAHSRIAPWINAVYFSRAAQAQSGNEQMMKNMTQQFGVPADKAQQSAQDVLGAKLVDPLEEIEGIPASEEMPADFLAPPLRWFRGLTAEVTKMEHRMVLHAELDLQRKPEEKPKFALPSFPSFNLFGGGDKTKPKKPETKPVPKPAPELLPPKNQPGVREF